MIRLLPIALVAAYLLAVTLPCPVQPGGREIGTPTADVSTFHSHHDEPSIAGGSVGATSPDCTGPILTEPCPCGCEQHAGAAPGGKRLGKMLLGDFDPAPARVWANADTPLIQLLRERDASPLDPVPIPA